MHSICLKDGPFADDFFPFSQTRSVADIRCGILTIRQKWEYFFTLSDTDKEAVQIPANVLPDSKLVEAIRKEHAADIEKALDGAARLSGAVDILRFQDREFRRDFETITKDRISQPIPASNGLVAGGQVFMEPGARMEHCLVNTQDGPVYIGKNALVMEGSMIRGPFALGRQSIVKMGSRIYGVTATGPGCVLGGELKNSIFFGYSNKAHDGYLGDSVIGEWCNLGGGTSSSNIRNDAGSIKLWNPLRKNYTDAGMKCGLFMGDYSRSAINTSFNTGTVVGICVNVFGKGLTPPYLSSFSWGYDPAGMYNFEKAVQHIGRWKQLKGQTISEDEIKRLKTIFDKQNNL